MTIFGSVRAQNVNFSEEDIKHEIRQLLKNQPDSALILIEQELSAGESNIDSNLLAFLYGSKGLIFREVDPDKAIEYFFKAQVLYKALGIEQNLAKAYSNIATFGNVSNAKKLSLLKTALNYSLAVPDSSMAACIYHNLGKYYSDLAESSDSSKYYFEKSRKINEKKGHKLRLSVNLLGLANIHLSENDFAAAATHLNRAQKLIGPNDEAEALFLDYSSLRLHFALQQADSGFSYFKKMQDNPYDFPQIWSNVYNLLAKFYEGQSDVKKALLYDQKSDSIRENLRLKNNENLLRFLEIEHEARLREETVAKLNARLDRSNTIRLLLVLAIMFVLSLIYLQRQKNRKKRELILEKKHRTEIELQNSELQLQMLNDELKFTNKELSSFATSIVKNKDYLDGLKQRVDCILTEKDLKKVKEQLADLRRQIIQLFHNDEQRKDFIKRSREINHALIFHLKSHYPQLNDGDVNLLVLLMLKFTSKEIATLYNIEVDSVGKRRYRLRQKLGLRNREDFDGFFDKAIAHFKVTHDRKLQ